MKLLIDRSGRIVVPKRLRERFGFRPDSEIEVVEGPGGLLLRPAQEKPSLALRKTAAQPHRHHRCAGEDDSYRVFETTGRRDCGLRASQAEQVVVVALFRCEMLSAPGFLSFLTLTWRFLLSPEPCSVVLQTGPG